MIPGSGNSLETQYSECQILSEPVTVCNSCRVHGKERLFDLLKMLTVMKYQQAVLQLAHCHNQISDIYLLFWICMSGCGNIQTPYPMKVRNLRLRNVVDCQAHYYI
jgi:hypothetical protein